jgi:hypothetical protein
VGCWAAGRLGPLLAGKAVRGLVGDVRRGAVADRRRLPNWASRLGCILGGGIVCVRRGPGRGVGGRCVMFKFEVLPPLPSLAVALPHRQSYAGAT